MALMTSFKLPCGSKNFYPEVIDYLTRKGSYVIFQTLSDKTNTAYLISPRKKGCEVVAKGVILDIVGLYGELDLIEEEVSDSNGVFFYKVANNQEEYEKSISNLVPDQI
ncbi:hypothetical protein ACPV3A_24340 [Paenibacillus sp. Dod16]|uniref:hypothetical protein n=1 Tax=Paenibacillus sp. Dod16 TaxID=3416392 RepID=UPI003CFA7212